MIEVFEHKAHISSELGIALVAVPAGLFIMGLWLIHGQFEHAEKQKLVLPITAALLFLTPFLNFGIYPVAIILVLSVMAKYILAQNHN